jgi:molybdate transport system regulatory protein
MIEVECHITIKNNGNTVLSPVTVKLLREVAKNGSLSAAAKNLKISYQHAWNLISGINSSGSAPLIEKQRGGANGGGATLTAYGSKILAEYQSIEKHISLLVGQINTEINM